MPRVRRIDLPNGAAVREQLHLAAMDMLPEEFAGDPLVEWVAGFDGLTRYSNEERSEGEAPFDQLAATLLNSKMSVYFAALFHIGRMIEVSNVVLGNVKATRERQNFEGAATLLAPFLSQANSERNAESTLGAVLEASEKFHVKQMELGHDWWSLWRKEVAYLHDTLEDESLHRRYSGRRIEWAALVKATLAPNTLQRKMAENGVQFKTGDSLNGDTVDENVMSVLAPLVVLFFAGIQHDSESLRHEARAIWHRWEREQQARRAEPAVKLAISHLQHKYGDSNPFDEYQPGRLPADEQLRRLVKDNQLPSNEDSPWKTLWKRSFEEMSWEDLAAPAMIDPTSGITILQADSAIKKNVGTAMSVGEGWNAFIQRLYEQEWIRIVGVRAGQTNKKAAPNVVWSVVQFSSFVQDVTLALNALGYALHCPPVDRLSTLLDKAGRGEWIHGRDDW